MEVRSIDQSEGMDNSEEIKRCVTISVLRYIFRRLASSCANQLFVRVMKVQVIMKSKDAQLTRKSFCTLLSFACIRHRERVILRKFSTTKKQKLKYYCFQEFYWLFEIQRKVNRWHLKKNRDLCRRVLFFLLRAASTGSSKIFCPETNISESIAQHAVPAEPSLVLTLSRRRHLLLTYWERWIGAKKSGPDLSLLLDSACYELGRSRQKWIAAADVLLELLRALRQTESLCHHIESQVRDRDQTIRCFQVLLDEALSNPDETRRNFFSQCFDKKLMIPQIERSSPDEANHRLFHDKSTISEKNRYQASLTPALENMKLQSASFGMEAGAESWIIVDNPGLKPPNTEGLNELTIKGHNTKRDGTFTTKSGAHDHSPSETMAMKIKMDKLSIVKRYAIRKLDHCHRKKLLNCTFNAINLNRADRTCHFRFRLRAEAHYRLSVCRMAFEALLRARQIGHASVIHAVLHCKFTESQGVFQMMERRLTLLKKSSLICLSACGEDSKQESWTAAAKWCHKTVEMCQCFSAFHRWIGEIKHQSLLRQKKTLILLVFFEVKYQWTWRIKLGNSDFKSISHLTYMKQSDLRKGEPKKFPSHSQVEEAVMEKWNHSVKSSHWQMSRNERRHFLFRQFVIRTASNYAELLHRCFQNFWKHLCHCKCIADFCQCFYVRYNRLQLRGTFKKWRNRTRHYRDLKHVILLHEKRTVPRYFCKWSNVVKDLLSKRSSPYSILSCVAACQAYSPHSIGCMHLLLLRKNSNRLFWFLHREVQKLLLCTLNRLSTYANQSQFVVKFLLKFKLRLSRRIMQSWKCVAENLSIAINQLQGRVQNRLRIRLMSIYFRWMASLTKYCMDVSPALHENQHNIFAFRHWRRGVEASRVEMRDGIIAWTMFQNTIHMRMKAQFFASLSKLQNDLPEMRQEIVRSVLDAVGKWYRKVMLTFLNHWVSQVQPEAAVVLRVKLDMGAGVFSEDSSTLGSLSNETTTLNDLGCKLKEDIFCALAQSAIQRTGICIVQPEDRDALDMEVWILGGEGCRALQVAEKLVFEAKDAGSHLRSTQIGSNIIFAEICGRVDRFTAMAAIAAQKMENSCRTTVVRKLDQERAEKLKLLRVFCRLKSCAIDHFEQRQNWKSMLFGFEILRRNSACANYFSTLKYATQLSFKFRTFMAWRECLQRSSHYELQDAPLLNETQSLKPVFKSILVRSFYLQRKKFRCSTWISTASARPILVNIFVWILFILNSSYSGRLRNRAQAVKYKLSLIYGWNLRFPKLERIMDKCTCRQKRYSFSVWIETFRRSCVQKAILFSARKRTAHDNASVLVLSILQCWQQFASKSREFAEYMGNTKLKLIFKALVTWRETVKISRALAYDSLLKSSLKGIADESAEISKALICFRDCFMGAVRNSTLLQKCLNLQITLFNIERYFWLLCSTWKKLKNYVQNQSRLRFGGDFKFKMKQHLILSCHFQQIYALVVGDQIQNVEVKKQVQALYSIENLIFLNHKVTVEYALHRWCNATHFWRKLTCVKSSIFSELTSRAFNHWRFLASQRLAFPTGSIVFPLVLILHVDTNQMDPALLIFSAFLSQLLNDMKSALSGQSLSNLLRVIGHETVNSASEFLKYSKRKRTKIYHVLVWLESLIQSRTLLDQLLVQATDAQSKLRCQPVGKMITGVQSFGPIHKCVLDLAVSSILESAREHEQAFPSLEVQAYRIKCMLTVLNTILGFGQHLFSRKSLCRHSFHNWATIRRVSNSIPGLIGPNLCKMHTEKYLTSIFQRVEKILLLRNMSLYRMAWQACIENCQAVHTSLAWRSLAYNLTLKMTKNQLRREAAIRMYQLGLLYSMRVRLRKRFSCFSVLKSWQRQTRH